MTTPDAAIVSAIYDSYDTLKPVMPQAGVNVDWVLVTDDESIRSGTLGWRVIHLPRPGVHPNRAAKQPKLFPWEFTPASASVWIDASLRVTSPDLVRDTLDLAQPIAQFVHPWRDCVYAEAEESARLAKYAGEDLDAQVKEYRRLRFPDHWGLWATTLIARHHDDVHVRNMSDYWGEMIDVFTFQDQVSQPVALRFYGLRPDALPGDQLTNQWTVWEGSGRH